MTIAPIHTWHCPLSTTSHHVCQIPMTIWLSAGDTCPIWLLCSRTHAHASRLQFWLFAHGIFLAIMTRTQHICCFSWATGKTWPLRCEEFHTQLSPPHAYRQCHPFSDSDSSCGVVGNCDTQLLQQHWGVQGPNHFIYLNTLAISQSPSLPTWPTPTCANAAVWSNDLSSIIISPVTIGLPVWYDSICVDWWFVSISMN